ncbi:MAG: endonuclease/exonuclease/phosphatase family protein [Saccharospirillum sp.]|nr:endonuclease/exonuclease/phosphatase family protein [Saccharospirillum sp.]
MTTKASRTHFPVQLCPPDDFLHKQNPNHLTLLSYNMQVGIHTRHYQDYLYKSWQHLWPSRSRLQNLQRIGNLIKHFDVVALQEADGGSFRSHFINQIEYLANLAGQPYWYQQLNRNLGRLAQHSNGVISRYHPIAIETHALPGLRGRGAIAVQFGTRDPLLLVMMHLALSKKGQDQQLRFVSHLIQRYPHVVLMGDMNTHTSRLLTDSPLSSCGLKAAHARATFPSWQPQRCLDHILVSNHLNITRVGVLDFPLSDHLPVALEIELPGNVELH